MSRADGSRFATISAAILTGGAGRPEGRDPLELAHRLGRLFDDVLSVGAVRPVDGPTRHVPDVDEGPACALRGLVSALAAARTERVLVVAGNRPPPPPALLLALVAWPEADVVWARSAAGPRPDCALYRRDAVLPVARAHLADGRLALHQLATRVETAELSPETLALLDPEPEASAAAGSTRRDRA
jgi:molybdopterin-guanine dinucleotide biosynthesis protein A